MWEKMRIRTDVLFKGEMKVSTVVTKQNSEMSDNFYCD